MKFLVGVGFVICFQTFYSFVSSSGLTPNVWFSGCTIKFFKDRTSKDFLFSRNSTTSTNFENECVRRVENIYICNASDLNNAVFICEAPYPIIWKFQVDQRLDVAYTTISNFNETTNGPVTTLYRGIITVTSNYAGSPSAVLTCASTESPKLSSSILTTFSWFQYWRPKETLHNYLGVQFTNKIVNPLIFSCPPFDQNNSNILQKKNSQNEWKPVTLSTSKEMRYNSSIGFVLNTTLPNVKDVLGEYSCPVKNSSHANFSVTYDIPFQSKSIISGNASVNLRTNYDIPDRPRMEIHCCSGVKGKPPIFLAFDCIIKEHCNFRKKELIEAFEHEMINQNKSGSSGENVANCKSAAMTHPMYLVICKGENVDFQETYVNAFHMLSNTSLCKRKEKILKADGVSSIGSKHKALLKRYVPESQVDGLQPQQKIFVMVARQLTKFATADSDQGKSFTMNAYWMFYLNQTHPTNVPFSNAKDNTLHKDLLEFERDVLYVGETITIGCIGLLYYYTEGAKITIKWKNGTSSEIPLQNFVERQGVQFMLLRDAIFSTNSYLMKTVDILSKPVHVTEDIDSFVCWMPTFGKSQWEKLAKPIKVKKPRFFEKAEEKLEVIAEKDKTVLTCTIHEWQPPANISVTWNDKPLQIKWKNTNDTVKPEDEKTKDVCVSGDRIPDNGTISIQIAFEKPKADKSGIYRCIAKNENMKVTRNISVTVSNGSR